MESILVPTKKLIQILKLKENIIDLSNIKFWQPIITLPLAAFISKDGRKFIKPTSEKCLGYLKYFNFPNGYTKFETLSSKYIPIYKFSASKKVCILDRGITIFGNYEKNGISMSDDQEALKNALEGLSTKQLETVRGSGLRTFTNMIREGFSGEMMIISGQAIAYANKHKMPLVQKISIDWDGTIVAIRIPKSSKSIEYASYIE